MRFDDALLQEIRDRNNLVQVVGDYVSLRKAGNNYMGLCPFHGEKTASFSVSEQRQFFYCFGCQTGGDVIGFVREMHGYSFMEAVRHLAERGGVDLPAPSREQAGGRSDDHKRREGSSRESKDAYFTVGRAAREFFRDALQGLRGEVCRAYVRERGLTSETAERFALGFAPDAWDSLALHLKAQGFSPSVVDKAGLVSQRKDGSGYYDRFRARLMFPIRNLAGEVIAFGGRSVPALEREDDDHTVAKYINSPETPVYTKGRTLFGLYEARRTMRQAGYALVVEGNVDVLMVSQAGLGHVVAPMGTALTPEQCGLLRRFVPRVVLIYDGDRAGQAAAVKAVPMALSAGLQVGVVTLAEGDDPDTLVRRGGAEALQELVDGAVAGWDFIVRRTLEELRVRDDPRTGIPRAVDRLAPVLQLLPDRRERLLHQRSLAGALGISDADLADFLRESRNKRPSPAASAAPAFGTEPARPKPAGPPPPEREWKLLLLLLLAPGARPLVQARDGESLVSSRSVRDAMELLFAMEEEAPDVDPVTVLSQIEDPTLKTILFRALSAAPSYENWSGELDLWMGGLQNAALERQQAELRLQQEAARSSVNEEEALMEIIRAKRAIQRERDPNITTKSS